MQLGQVVDFCIEYNKRHRDTEETPKKEYKYRMATTKETSAYFGR